MDTTPPDFTTEQWRFLALFDALGPMVSAEMAGRLEPLPPGPLLDLIDRAGKLGWLAREAGNRFTLTNDLPEQARRKIAAINTPGSLSVLADRIRALPPEKHPPAEVFIEVMRKGGLHRDAALYEIELAETLLESERYPEAWQCLRRAANDLTDPGVDGKNAFITAVITLSNLSFALGKGLTDLAGYLHRAQEAARQLGDRRSHALINMHLGRLFYFADRRSDAMVALSVGLNEIEGIADEDMLDQSAVFMGLFYFMQGLFKDALPHLDRAERLYRRQEKRRITTPLAPILLGYCLAYLGEFHRAIGSLDCHWRMAREKSDYTLATTLRMILGTVLLLIRRDQEAAFHLEEAHKEAQMSSNALAQYLGWGPMALQLRKAGQLNKGHALLTRALEQGAASGLVRQYASPWIMEMIYELERMGYPSVSGMTFDELAQRARNENNVHLQGVAFRLRAQRRMAENAPIREAMDDLASSLSFLEQSGDIVQLSRTLIEKARLALLRSQREEGRQLVRKAWTVLGGYADEFFPDDLRYLIDPDRHGRHFPELPPDSFDRYIELTEAMFPIHGREEIMSRAVEATNRFFGAERGGLFWFPKGKMTRDPQLRAGCNLTETDVRSKSFGAGYEFIIKAFASRRPLLQRRGNMPDGSPPPGGVRAMLCLPVEIRGKIRAVMYHDNTYLEDCFDFLDTATLQKMVNHVSRQVARIWEYYQVREEHHDLVEKTIALQESPPYAERELLYGSPAMDDLIAQMDRAARSDSTILILGETGVGKELAARRIHAQSRRKNRTFMVLDAASIPGTLIESELFGHEKGAFTGADRQRRGRLELADKGTLFIDEIGELPLAMQTKLLRAIQERTFYRVGGTRALHSDFRLIAATNRDLEKEVAQGRFRQDLFYRLNVVPFRIPPLRERQEDVLILAEYFLQRFARKYSRPALHLDRETRRLLTSYHWPGNVRELENIIERSALLSAGDRLEIDLTVSRTSKDTAMFEDLPTLDELQQRYIRYVLERTGGRVGGPGGASRILGIKRTTLYARMKKLGMR